MPICDIHSLLLIRKQHFRKCRTACSTRLFKSTKQDWKATAHPLFSELFYVLNGCGSFIVKKVISDPKTESDHHQPEHPPTEVSDKNSPQNTLSSAWRGLNFLIYNDKKNI